MHGRTNKGSTVFDVGTSNTVKFTCLVLRIPFPKSLRYFILTRLPISEHLTNNKICGNIPIYPVTQKVLLDQFLTSSHQPSKMKENLISITMEKIQQIPETQCARKRSKNTVLPSFFCINFFSQKMPV